MVATAGDLMSCPSSEAEASPGGTSRGARRREARRVASGKLTAAFERVVELEAEVASLRAHCKLLVSAETELDSRIDDEVDKRLAAIKLFLRAQVSAAWSGDSTVDMTVFDKLLRDAAEHCRDPGVLENPSYKALRQCRKQERLPSRVAAGGTSSEIGRETLPSTVNNAACGSRDFLV